MHSPAERVALIHKKARCPNKKGQLIIAALFKNAKYLSVIRQPTHPYSQFHLAEVAVFL